MPYSETTLSGSDITTQMKAALDAALTAHGGWSRVTAGHANGTRSFDVWANDGARTGYPWFVVVSTASDDAGRVLLGGMLEYDPATSTARKAICGGASKYAGPDGYQASDYPLGNFASTSDTGTGLLGASSQSFDRIPAVANNKFLVLVSGTNVWIGFVSSTDLRDCHGVGCYTRMHLDPLDAKPLANVMSVSSGSGRSQSVWQSPAAADNNYTRVMQDIRTSGPVGVSSLNQMSGYLNIDPPGDRLLGNNALGSLLVASRDQGDTIYGRLDGNLLGTFSPDFLIFQVAQSTPVGFEAVIDGRTYRTLNKVSTSQGGWPAFLVCKEPV